MAAAAGAVVGALVVAIAALAGYWPGEPAPGAGAPPRPSGPSQQEPAPARGRLLGPAGASSGRADAGEAEIFIAAWRVHLLSSWSVDQVQDRTTDAGAHLRIDVHEAQRPPDRVRIGLGSVDARRGQTLIACASASGDSSGRPACRAQATKTSWQDEVDNQLAALRGALVGNRAVFTVMVAGPGCFVFRLRGSTGPVPVTLGRGARYCLDPQTGAVLSSTVQRVGALDSLTTIEHHSPATDTDLALPPGAVAGPSGAP